MSRNTSNLFTSKSDGEEIIKPTISSFPDGNWLGLEIDSQLLMPSMVELLLSEIFT
jgi:hypothetical protein